MTDADERAVVREEPTGRKLRAHRERQLRDGLQPKEDGMAVDPVCGMTVDEKGAAWRSEYQGATYVFCSPGCKRTFDKEPAKYAKLSPASGHGHVSP